MENQKEDKLGIIMTIISFLFPIVGIAIFFIAKNKGLSNRAKTAILCAAIAIVLNVAYFAFYGFPTF